MADPEGRDHDHPRTPPVQPVVRRSRRSEADDRSDISADDTDIGWGERNEEAGSDEWYRRERPPHHGD